MYIALIFRHKKCGNEELDNLAHTYRFGATFTLSFELQKSKVFCAAFFNLEYEGKLSFFKLIINSTLTNLFIFLKCLTTTIILIQTDDTKRDMHPSPTLFHV